MEHRLNKITEAISHEEAQLARLDLERQAILDRLHDLRQQLSAIDIAPSLHQEPSGLSPTVKISLFRSLFRGREDVYPKLWISKNGDRKGYMPACANDGNYTLCGKRKFPRVKCGDCHHQAYLPVSDEVIRDHLQGKQTIGVYPLLPNDTCRFLAVDFDKSSWQEDVAAFRETCSALDLPVAIERSRSGNGAHAWFFFTEPVMATVARIMGCYLITETMSRRHQLSMESYDRLFPSQDTMPRGGFGNLIALPLQGEPRKLGNSVFVDESFAPYADQWGHLSSLKRLSPSEVQTIADRAARKGQVIGLNLPSEQDEDQTPWERLPSGRAPEQRLKGKLPKKIKAILAQRIFVETKGVPSALLNRIKRLAAFQNPEFFKKQKMRLSTHNTPRVIACFEELPEHVALPRGCRDALQSLLDDHGISLHIDDKRHAGTPTDFNFHGTLSDIQQQTVAELIRHDIGIFVAPPGSGKTVVGAWLAAARNCSTLVLVHRKPLLDQWVAQLSRFLNLPPKKIGIIGSGKSKATGILDVAMMQSLVRKDAVADLVANYGQVIVDECHHLPAFSFERVLGEVKAKYVVGLTATPYRRDGHQPIIHLQCGPTRFSLNRKQQETDEAFTRRLILRETGFILADTDGDITIQEIYARLTSDRQRNQLILADIRQALAEGREVQVYDYVDSSVPMLAKMHEKRMRGFKTMGYGKV